MTSARTGASVSALSVPAAAYGLAVRLRNAWYDRADTRHRAPIPVVSVGNLAVGGTGKTPLVAWIAKHLRAEGCAPAIVSRGYGGTAGPGPVLVSIGAGARVDARVCGDEPFLLARSLPGVIVVVGADRVEAARAAAAAGASMAILDDGFQHRRLARDLDVVALDGRAPFGNRRLLPAGPLREPPSASRRADLIVLTRLSASDPAAAAIEAARAAGFGGPIVRAGHTAVGFVDSAGAPAAAPRDAVAFCGIGDPDLFRSDLEAVGTRLAGFETFRDHHAYDLATWDRLAAWARGQGVPLVTTEKDVARLGALPGWRADAAPILALRIEAAIWDQGSLLGAVHRAIADGRAAPR